MRLIDAEKLSESIMKMLDLALEYNEHKIYNCIYEIFIPVVVAQPTVEAEPIKHGHWIEEKNWYECSVCGSGTYFIKDEYLPEEFNALPNYCSDCGAKMDEVTDNE